MGNWGIQKSDHITWKLYILPTSVIRHKCIELTEISDNEITSPKIEIY